MTLQELESALAAAKAARDMDKCRELVPLVNAARKTNLQEQEAAKEAATEEWLKTASPHDRLIYSIFGR